MNITISGIQSGVVKDVIVALEPQMTMELLRKSVAEKIDVDYRLLQIKQNHFYYRDEDLISDITELDISPFSFEIGNASIPIDIQYGPKRICVLVDGCCPIRLLKKRFSQIMKSDIVSMKVVYALYNDVICKDTCTLEEIGVTPFSTIFMCSDLYELVAHLPDSSTITLYKHYNTPFDTLQQEIAKHCSLDPLLVSISVQTPTREQSLSTSTDPLFKLFDTSTISLHVSVASLQEMAATILRMEKQEGLYDDATRESESGLEAEALAIDKEIKALQLVAETQRKEYIGKVSGLLKEVGAMSEKMDMMLEKLDEIELIRREQVELLRQCDLLEGYGELVPEAWELVKSIDSIESTLRAVGGFHEVKSEGLSVSRMEGENRVVECVPSPREGSQGVVKSSSSMKSGEEAVKLASMESVQGVRKLVSSMESTQGVRKPISPLESNQNNLKPTSSPTESHKIPTQPISSPIKPIHSISSKPLSPKAATLPKPNSSTIHNSLREPLSPEPRPPLLPKTPPPIRHSLSPTPPVPPVPPAPPRRSSPVPPKSVPPPPPRRSSSPAPPKSLPPTPPPLPSSVPSRRALPKEETTQRIPSGITIMKPSQMKERMKFMEEMNARMGKPFRPKPVEMPQQESDPHGMPSLHSSFAPPKRPTKRKM